MLGLSPLLGNRHLADHTVPPSIIASIAVASILTQGFTGWSLLISIIVAILPGAILGMILGLLLTAVLNPVLSFFIRDDS